MKISSTPYHEDISRYERTCQRIYRPSRILRGAGRTVDLILTDPQCSLLTGEVTLSEELAPVVGALRGERTGPPNIRSPHRFHQLLVNTRVVPPQRQEGPDRVFLLREKPHTSYY